MKIGVEEEFIVVDPKTYWINPGGFRLANSIVYADSQYIWKCNVELPLHSASISQILSHLSKGFCVFELKTNPYSDIDLLRDELWFHRQNLIEKALDNNLLILPCGLHPAHRSTDFIDNCAAFHVHVDYTRDRFERLRAHIPFLISVSSNSPFLDGRPYANSTRMLLSPHVNVARTDDALKRNADLIYNPSLRTVEVKVFDSQITTDEAMGLVNLVKAIAENNEFNDKLSEEEYKTMRDQSIRNSSADMQILLSEDELNILKDYNEMANEKVSMKTGSSWQKEIYQEHGLSSVVSSLSHSFFKDKRIKNQTDDQVNTELIRSGNLAYLLPYFPFFVLEKYHKYKQDMSKIGGLKKIR